MLELNIVIAMTTGSLVIAAVLLWKSGGERQRQANSQQRLSEALARVESHGEFVAAPAPDAWLPALLEIWLRRAGLAPSQRLYGWLAAPGLLVAFGAGFFWGFKAAAVGLLVVYPAGLAMFLQWRIENFRNQVVAQLPDFLDSVVRILSIGCSLDLAFRNACEDSRDPLKGVFSQVLLRTQAGTSLEDALSQVAETCGVKEIKFLAAVFYLGMRYGGNAQAILDRIALTLRERERGQRELRAMTSETRASAWILSALPVVVGTMTLFANPDYLLGMWRDGTGRQLLMAAGGLQVAGMFLLFRMAKIQ
ncbi:MAG: type II secretion system F family protein [Sulfuricella sp.]|nr:type II secretion system F family protein [Sulfuricella sp.]